ncbi:hypothetical protein [Salinigranum marinum]|uniref:hypothetical protein n=1 Tax=Salinigranum marinum TaxID=1515595 RepID=UPI002989F45D|nr:hypothetical protein [Salinigranum marinum]
MTLVVPVVVAKQATRVERSAGFPELDHVGLVFIRVESLLVVGAAQLATERILDTRNRLFEISGFVRHRS